MDSNHDKVIQSHQNHHPLVSANSFKFAQPVDIPGPEIESTVRVFENLSLERFRQSTIETRPGHLRNAIKRPLCAFPIRVIDRAEELFECAGRVVGEVIKGFSQQMVDELVACPTDQSGEFGGWFRVLIGKRDRNGV